MPIDPWFQEFYQCLAAKFSNKIQILTHKYLNAEYPYVLMEKSELQNSFDKISFQLDLHILSIYQGWKEEEEWAAKLKEFLDQSFKLSSCDISLKLCESSSKNNEKVRQLTMLYKGLVKIHKKQD
jgi:hypothetical protein